MKTQSTNQEVGQRFREILTDKFGILRDAATKLGMSESNLQKYLDGESNVSKPGNMIIKRMKVLGINENEVKWIFHGGDKPFGNRLSNCPNKTEELKEREIVIFKQSKKIINLEEQIELLKQQIQDNGKKNQKKEKLDSGIS